MWQPKYINKLKVTTTLPLYLTTKDRINHNMSLYLDEITAHNVPSAGGFSINVFTLNNLYNLFLQGRAWWSHSNNETPLVRFTGAKITLYRSESSDFIFKYFTCYPMSVSLEAYNSTQPSFMQLSKNHYIMRCKKNNYLRKPTKKIKIRPPSQLTNKWYFQKDLADTPLLMTFASAMSLDRYYLPSTAPSTSTGFKGLNTKMILYHNFQQQTTHGYHIKDGIYLWSVQQTTPTPNTLQNIQAQNLIFLGNAQNAQTGQTIKDAAGTTVTEWSQMKTHYLSSWTYWGNPFIPPYLTGKFILLYTKTHPSDVLQKVPSKETTLASIEGSPFKYWADELIIQYRYNAFQDSGPGNKIYLTDLHSQTPDWEPPASEKEQNNNLPLWLGLWGYSDFQKLNKVPFDTERLVVIQTTHVWPPDKYIVPIDDDFLAGNSPFRPNQLIPSDKLYWHPKGSFQLQSLTTICQTGPGTIKLASNISAEAHMKLTFYFKLGGCAQPIKNIDKPSDQPDFPLPSTEHGSYSLQSPATGIENYFYSFDWRRHLLTKKATDRIQKDTDSEIPFIASAGLSSLNAAPLQTAPEGTEETSEEEKETLLNFFNLLKHKQQRYRERILQLMALE